MKIGVLSGRNNERKMRWMKNTCGNFFGAIVSMDYSETGGEKGKLYGGHL